MESQGEIEQGLPPSFPGDEKIRIIFISILRSKDMNSFVIFSGRGPSTMCTLELEFQGDLKILLKTI